MVYHYHTLRTPILLESGGPTFAKDFAFGAMLSQRRYREKIPALEIPERSKLTIGLNLQTKPIGEDDKSAKDAKSAQTEKWRELNSSLDGDEFALRDALMDGIVIGEEKK